jgi:hypothetical protein
LFDFSNELLQFVPSLPDKVHSNVWREPASILPHENIRPLFFNTKIHHTDNTVLDGRKAAMPAYYQAIRLENRLKTDRRKIIVDIPSNIPPLQQIKLDTNMLCQ